MSRDALLQLLVPVLVGFLVWLVRQVQRLSTHEAVCAERYQRLDDRLGRIEQSQKDEHAENKETLQELRDALSVLAGRR